MLLPFLTFNYTFLIILPPSAFININSALHGSFAVYENVKNIVGNPKEINYEIGYGSVNKKKLQEKNPNLKFISDSNVLLGTFVAQK